MSYKSKTFIKGSWKLLVEVDTDAGPDEAGSQAYLEHWPSGAGGSLAFADDMGWVETAEGIERPIPSTVIIWAVQTAEGYGY